MQLIVNLYINIKEKEFKTLKRLYQPNVNLVIYKKNFSATFRQKFRS